MSRKNRRGFTLVELMVSITLMLVAVVGATTIMILGASMDRNATNAIDDQDHVRMAAQVLIKALRSAGLFAPGGIYSYGGSPSPTLVSPIWVTTNTGYLGSDELWVVSPDDNALRQACLDPGASIPMVSGTPTTLTLTCGWSTGPNWGTTPTFATTDQLVVANGNTGALVTVASFANSGGLSAITVGTNSATYTDTGLAGNGKGYLPGDVVYRASVNHYYIQDGGPPSHNLPALYVDRQKQDGTNVWVDDTSGSFGPRIVQRYIENIQLEFALDTAGTGNPATYTLANSLSMAMAASNTVRSVRLNVVGISAQHESDTAGRQTETLGLGPMSVGDYTAPSTPDGYRRYLYTERLELPNFAPSNL